MKEEEFFRKRFFELTSHLPKKEKVNFIESKIIKEKKSKKSDDKNLENINNKFIWLKYKENSCRYDTFTLIYYFVLEDILEKKIIPQNIQQVIISYNDLVRTISLSSKEDYNKGIWKFIDNLKDDPLNFKNTGYKVVYAISQLFSPLNNNNIFCFEIHREENCFKCNYNVKTIDYLGPIIQINFEDLHLDIRQIMEQKFTNQFVLCHKCTWINSGNTILSNTPTLSKIIKNINVPEVIFLFLDIGGENDDIYQVYNNLKVNIELIKNFIKEDFYVFNDKFSLKAIICMPYSNHYSCFIIKSNKNVDYIKLGCSYYYDSQKFNNSLIEIDNYMSFIKNDCIPYILVYIKII